MPAAHREDEQVFEELFRRLGLSVDWPHQYTTIGTTPQRTSQRAFLRNLARGEAYSADAPTLWDVTFRMAVSPGRARGPRARPARTTTSPSTARRHATRIATTRPELLVSCVALVAHPDDARYQPLFGTTVTTPIFGVEVPVVAHHLAEPDKGTGIAMICTFGDTTDVTWWRELKLPTRAVIGRDGRFAATRPSGSTRRRPRRYAEIAGQERVQAGASAMVEILRETGELTASRSRSARREVLREGRRPARDRTSPPVVHPQRRPRRRAGGGAHRPRRRDRVAPAYMRHRYENWVGGLNGDWLVSRQRFFGVPFPVWYPLDAEGEPDHDHPLLPDDADLPIDPQSTPRRLRRVPARRAGRLRRRPRHLRHVGDLVADAADRGRMGRRRRLFDRVFPMDLRPQGHDIIRTWLFSTTVRSHFEHGARLAPRRVSGWILDPDRKKRRRECG